MGPPQNDRIGVLLCADGTPIFPGCSVTPVELEILSLPPKERIKEEYMPLSMLFSTTLKCAAQKKYFDFVVAVDLNPLATVGARHTSGFTKVIVFGTPLDLPGRDKFFRFRGYQSKHGCPDCVHENPTYNSKMMSIGGTRRLLPPDSPLRQRRCGVYQFVNAELRPPAAKRTTHLMKVCLQIAKDQNLLHVCGFAGSPAPSWFQPHV